MSFQNLGFDVVEVDLLDATLDRLALDLRIVVGPQLGEIVIGDLVFPFRGERGGKVDSFTLAGEAGLDH